MNEVSCSGLMCVCILIAHQVFDLRSMLAVPYFEKALYEMPEDQLTPENVLALADKIELEIQGGPSGRPLMSVPHILSDESSCYYHGASFASLHAHISMCLCWCLCVCPFSDV